ncbi:MAG: glycoside hydrolase family 5 protein [Fibromonadales bacterium]|nr:glycoside hydrolase family 5 protein [Fibromonadales bacterium]
MKSAYKILKILAILLIGVQIMISCSGVEIEPLPLPKDVHYVPEGDGSGATYTYCVYLNTSQCFSGNFSACPGGGNLSNTCPFPPKGSIPDVPPPNLPVYDYCVYPSFCINGPIFECAGGELSNTCPYPSSSSNSNDLGSSSSSDQLQIYEYCVFVQYGICTEGPFTSCVVGGQLSNNCPFQPIVISSSSSLDVSNSSSSGIFSSSSFVASISSSSFASIVSSSSVFVSGGENGPVAYYGELKASGSNIIGSKTGSTPVQVRGVSLFWSNTGWGGDAFFNATAINAMVDGWKAEIIRVPMGYDIVGGKDYNGSYLPSKTANMDRVHAAISAAIAKGIYVIIDWHAHNAHLGTSDAIEFFTEMASTYGSYDNVIFEIYNEPLCSNGTTNDTGTGNYCPSGFTTWAQIKSYATDVISTIRTYSDNLILVGTPTWSQDVDAVVGSAITASNVAYVLHFYAATHSTSTLGAKINTARSAGLPIFVSEYGTVSADGNGTHNATASNTWMSFLNERNISYCAWAVNNKNEAASFFIPAFSPSTDSYTLTSNMTSSGLYIYNQLASWANSAPWRGGATPSSSSSSNTRCKDSQGREYFCEWASGCFAIDPAYAENPGHTCTYYINECMDYGRGLYVNSTREGAGAYCTGTFIF